MSLRLKPSLRKKYKVIEIEKRNERNRPYRSTLERSVPGVPNIEK